MCSMGWEHWPFAVRVSPLCQKKLHALFQNDSFIYRATFQKNMNGYRIQVCCICALRLDRNAHRNAPLQRLSTRGLTQMGIQKFEHQKVRVAYFSRCVRHCRINVPGAQAIMAALREASMLLPEFDGR